MEMKYYNASNNFKAPIPREPKPYRPPQKPIYEPKPYQEEPVESAEEIPCPCEEITPVVTKNSALSFDQDDYLLIGLILILLMNGCDDYLLLIVLGYLLITGKRV